MAISTYQLACERAEGAQLKNIGDDDLVRVVLGHDVGLAAPVATLARAPSQEVADVARRLQGTRSTPGHGLRTGSARSLGPPVRGQRCLDPATVYEIMKDMAHEEVEEFHVVLLDVRGRLLGRRLVARGSISQCPVSPRDALRAAVREGATASSSSHNHPSR